MPDVEEPDDAGEVLALLAEGLSNKEIGNRLHVTEATVKFHVGKLLRKTGAKDRRGLARTYQELAASAARRRRRSAPRRTR